MDVFRETTETERMFHQVREKMRQMNTLKKMSDPGKVVVLCLIGGIVFSLKLP